MRYEDRMSYEIEHSNDNVMRFGNLTIHVEMNSFLEEFCIKPDFNEIDDYASRYFGVGHVTGRCLDFMYKHNYHLRTKEDFQRFLIMITCYTIGQSDAKIKAFIMEDHIDRDRIKRYQKMFFKMWDREPFVRACPYYEESEHILADEEECLTETPRQQFRIGEKGFYEIKPTVLPELKIARPSVQFKFD